MCFYKLFLFKALVRPCLLKSMLFLSPVCFTEVERAIAQAWLQLSHTKTKLPTQTAALSKICLKCYASPSPRSCTTPLFKAHLCFVVFDEATRSVQAVSGCHTVNIFFSSTYSVLTLGNLKILGSALSASCTSKTCYSRCLRISRTGRSRDEP